MLPQLIDLPVYSDDIWDYLSDVRYMPTRIDRDALVEQAQESPNDLKRIQIWNYFFRFNPEDVGIPLQKEKQDLVLKMKDAHIEDEQSSTKLEELKADFESKKNNAEHLILEQHKSKSSNNRIIGILTGVIAAPFFILPIVLTWIGIMYNIRNGIPITLSSIQNLLSNNACCLPIGLILAGVSAWQLYSSKTPSKERLKYEVDKFLTDEEVKVSKMTEEYSTSLQNNKALYPEYQKRIEFLENKIGGLKKQLPTPPSDEQVETWLKEEINSLSQAAILDSGLQDRLITLLNAKNPFITYSPAEIQDEKNLRDVFLTQSHWDKTSDRFKHFHAKRFTTMPDGTFADFHGIYSVRLLMFAENEWSSYETVYNFIRGKSTGKKTTRYDYINVVAIKTLRTVRTIQSAEGQDIEVENIPSLSVSLTNQEQVNISFPDEGYFRQYESGKNFSEAKWRYNPQLAAENAVKNFKEKVNEAQRNRDNIQPQ
jgi:hypothetical protein